MKEKTNTGLVILIILLFVVLICLSLYILWDKSVISNDISSENSQTQNNTDSGSSKLNVNLTSYINLKNCLNFNGSAFFDEVLESYYGLQVILKENKWYIRLYEDSDLAREYPETIAGKEIEIEGLDSSKVINWHIIKGSDLRMLDVLFLMQDGTMMYLNTYKALTGVENAQIATKIEGVSDVEIIETVALNSPGYLTLAITRKGVAYIIGTSGNVTEISIPTFDTLNINAYEAIKDIEIGECKEGETCENLLAENFYGFIVEHKYNHFYIRLVQDSDLAHIYPELATGVEYIVQGIDSSKVAKVSFAYRGSDVKMPDVLFLMEDGTVYILKGYDSLNNKAAYATLIENVQGVIHISYAYMDKLLGLEAIGITKSGDFYKL